MARSTTIYKTATAAASDAVIKGEPTAAAKKEALQSTHDEQVDAASMAAQFMAAMGLPVQTETVSKTRAIITLVARIAGYAVGIVGSMYIVGYLSMMMATFGLPTFIAAVVEIFAFILSMIASWKASDMIVDFVASGGISRSFGTARNWFNSKVDSFSLTNKQAAAE